MNPVLIYTDTLQINNEKAVLSKGVALFQNVYNAYKAIGITPALQDIYNQITETTKTWGNTGTLLKNYALSQLAALAGNYEYNAVQLNQSALLNMITVPDLTAVTAALSGTMNIFGYGAGANGLRFDLLTVANDIVGTVADSDAQIEATYTYYTKTDASAQLATDLQTICTALNTFDSEYQSNGLVTKYANANSMNQRVLVAPGIEAITGLCVVSLNYIRTFERLQAN